MLLLLLTLLGAGAAAAGGTPANEVESESTDGAPGLAIRALPRKEDAEVDDCLVPLKLGVWGVGWGGVWVCGGGGGGGERR